MSNQNLTPRPDYSLAPADKSQIKQGVISNILSAPLVSWGGAALSFVTTTLITSLRGLSLPLAIILGVGVAFVLALTANLIDLVIVRHRKPVLPLSPILVKEPCPDKSIHEYAERDARNIDEAVRLVGRQFGLGMARLPTPYVQFKFTVFNGSAYVVSIDRDIKGFILFQGKRLQGDLVTVPGSHLENLQHAATGAFEIRQFLEREQADAILETENAQDSFNFEHLYVTIKGGKSVEPKPLRMTGLP